jgi:hypothetical protein
VKWSEQRVIHAVQDWYRRGKRTGVWRRDIRLKSAAARYFGSWDNALAAAGLEPLRRKWTKELILEETRKHCRQGTPLHRIRQVDGRLGSAARYHFATWHDALVAAGVATEASRPGPCESWSKQRVIDELRARHRQGLPLTSVAPNNRKLYSASKRLFGTWGEALLAAEVDKSGVRK